VDIGFVGAGLESDVYRHHRRVGTIEGPTIGVIVFYTMQHYLADFGTWYLILLGALAIATMLFVAHRYRVALLPVRRMLTSEIKFDRVPRGRRAANSE
jgi:hypothetical protein